MDNLPLVSIITPSYNQAAYLENTLRSVFAQDYPRIEYLVVDGGSNDSSVDIIKRYAHRLSWWVSERDAGQAEAINKGMRASKGEIIGWLNSDDLYLPGAVSGAVAALQRNKAAGMVYSNAVSIDSHGRPTNLLVFEKWGLLDLMSFRIICQPAVFMRREIFERAGMLDASFHFMLDHHLWIRMCRLAPIDYASDKFWAAARMHAGAKNVSQAEGFARETQLLLAWMKSQADLGEIIRQNRQKVEAGAHRLRGRYLLDGGLPRQALVEYVHAFRLMPSYALKHWRRMIYAVLCLVGGKQLGDLYYLLKRSRPPAFPVPLPPEGWPGIQLTENGASRGDRK